MSLCYLQPRDYAQAFLTTRQQVSATAAVLTDQADALLALALALQTNDEAMHLYHVAAGLRDKLTAIVDVALDQADRCTGRVVGTITPELPWGTS